MEPVRSRQNRKVVEAARLLRARDGIHTLLQGEKLVEEALSCGVEIERLFVLSQTNPDRWSGDFEVVPVTEPVMERLAPTGDTWGPVAVAQISERAPRQSRPVLVPVDIADPGNLGSMIRSAAAFGYDVAVVGGTDPWSPKTLRAGAGGHFRSHVSRTPAPPDRPTIAAVVAGGRSPRDLLPPHDHALLVGSEARGLPEQLVATAMEQVTIPMRATESLNAASAAAVLMFALGGNDSGANHPQD